MHNVMIDLETLGNKPTAPIVAIGAAFFDPATGNVGATFSVIVLLNSEMALGAVPDASTIIWWMMQSTEARAAICDSEAKSILVALHELNAFIKANRVGKSVKVWGNGASFDNVILRAAYHRANIQPFWNFYDDLDVRTIVEIGRRLGIDPKREIPFTGERHNALADALHQVQYVSTIFQHIDAMELSQLNEGAAK